MPQFYFHHVNHNGHRQVDPLGLDLPSLHTALDEAAFAARCTAAVAAEPVSGCYEIENEAHRVVARVPYVGVPDDDDLDEDAAPPRLTLAS